MVVFNAYELYFLTKIYDFLNNIQLWAISVQRWRSNLIGSMYTVVDLLIKGCRGFQSIDRHSLVKDIRGSIFLIRFTSTIEIEINQ